MIESTTPIPAGRWRGRLAVDIAAAVLLAALSRGCAVVGWGLDSVTGGEKEVEVEAEYRGLEGTNVEQGRQLLAESGLPIIGAEDLDDAAQKICAALQGA